MNANRVAHRLALAAGLMDGATGLGLVALPAWTLARMSVPVPALVTTAPTALFEAQLGLACCALPLLASAAAISASPQ